MSPAETSSPADDAEPEVTPFWRDLGLPGLFDVHVHFLPPNVQAKVWAQFDVAGPKIGREWPIRYRGSHEERVQEFADVLAWLATLANTVNVNLEEAIRVKYAAGCPGCRSVPCRCDEKEKP